MIQMKEKLILTCYLCVREIDLTRLSLTLSKLAFNGTGHLTPRSDVYSFGVVLLELLTGRRALEDDRPGVSEETLVDWAMPFLSDSRRVLRIMDTRLGGQYSKKGAQAAASLALQCLNTDPKFRPPMVEVLATLEGLHSLNSIPRTPKSGIESHTNRHFGHAQK